MISNFYQKLIQSTLIAGGIFATTPLVWATSFTIDDGETVTATQTLVDGETGLIVSGGFLNVIDSKAIAVSDGISTSIAITNNGKIISLRDAIEGPGGDNTGAIATVINNGTIVTQGNTGDADAVNFGGATAPTLILTNNGFIKTTGIVGAEAVLVGGENNIIINNGTIDTAGATSDAITFSCDNCGTITNNGTIITRGFNAHGIFYLNPGGAQVSLTITNTGSIVTEGQQSNGILLNNEATVIVNNSGLIRVLDSAEEAIRGGSGAETLNLQSGSQIIGIIDLNNGTDIVNISGANNSSTLTLTDTENINLLNDNGLLVGDVVTVVDPTGQSVSSAVLSSTTFAVHNVLNQRLAHHQPLKPIQVATSELTSGMVFQERQPQIWGSALGEMRERDLEGIALGYDHNYVGFTGGYEVSFYKARIGLLGGVIRSEVKTTGDKFGRLRSVDTDTDSFFVGAYSQYFLGGINLTTTLMAGYEDHENDRAVVDNLNGFETAQADFSSFFISPSLTLSSAYRVGTQVELRPSVTFAYSAGWYDDYIETGTTRSDLVIDDRNVHALTSQLQLAAAYSFFEESEFEIRAGAKARYTDDDDIDVNLAGTGAAFQIPNVSDDSVYGGYVGMNLRVAIVDRINLVADVEHGRAGGGEEHIALMLKLEGVFN
jgi:outer membrane autotransporter protein